MRGSASKAKVQHAESEEEMARAQRAEADARKAREEAAKAPAIARMELQVEAEETRREAARMKEEAVAAAEAVTKATEEAQKMDGGEAEHEDGEGGGVGGRGDQEGGQGGEGTLLVLARTYWRALSRSCRWCRGKGRARASIAGSAATTCTNFSCPWGSRKKCVMSATKPRSHEVVLEYSGAKQGLVGTVLAMDLSAADNGAALELFLQYPAEADIVFNACSYLEACTARTKSSLQSGARCAL